MPKPEWQVQNRQVVSPADKSVIGVPRESHAAKRTNSSRRGPLDSEPIAVHETATATHSNGN